MTGFENHQAEATALTHLFNSHDPFAVLTHLAEDDFTRDDYRTAFVTMRDRVEGGAKVRGDASLAGMMAPIVRESNKNLRGGTLIKTLKELTQRRKIMEVSIQIGSLASDYSIKSKELLERSLALMDEARDDRIAGGKLTTVADATKRMVENFHLAIGEREASGDSKTGITCGFPALDDIIRFKRGDFVAIGGRTGSGKTATALTMAKGMIEAGHRVCYLCREMKDVDLVQRLAAQTTGENGRNFTRGVLTVSPAEFEHGIGRLVNMGDSLTFGTPKTLAEALMMANQARERHQAEIFFFDYIQQFRVPTARSPREATMKVTDSLKFFAMENDCVSVGLAQLNRGATDTSGGKTPLRPRIKHFKESGSIEEDADIVALLWNPLNEDKGIEKEYEQGILELSCDLHGRKFALDERRANRDTRLAMYFDKYRGGERFRACSSYNGARTEVYFDGE